MSSQKAKQTPLRIGIIGVGIMGQNHARVYDRLKSVELVAVVDTDLTKARNVADKYGCQAFRAYEDIVDLVDAVSICVPSVHHAKVGSFCFEHGLHCLIEKPLATTEADCKMLIAAAKKANCVLSVGHVERFNPAVQQLRKIIPQGAAVHAIDARRMSSSSARITDVDVVQDLMVHDIDIVLSLMGSDVVDIRAKGVDTNHAAGQDYVTALLSFSNGAIASITASRITQHKIRQLNLTTDLGYITLNYMTQELLVHRQGQIGRIGGQSSEYSNYVLDQAIERVFVRNAEPLYLELEEFVDAILNNHKPLVTGQDAFSALKVSWQIQEAVKAALEQPEFV